MTDKPKKRWIALKERVDIGGEIRSPAEGAIAVASDLADDLVKAGKATSAKEPKPAASDQVDTASASTSATDA